VRLLAERGVVAAIGHTDADLATTRAAVEAGATGATHLFNAMPALHHRNPGPILALAAAERVWLELIADGVHVHLDLVAEVMKRWPDRVVLVTDAMAAAGQPDGDYQLGELIVRVEQGVARLAGADTIAGSTLTLSAAVRNVIGVGVGWQQALRAATSLPARYLGLEAGELLPGRSADLVVWDADWRPVRILRRGAWQPAASD
ncbi:MAG: amidohydrolase family protein, partial [Brooklawnia sp.]|uniref:amidohydrolase family protein n=1 Tax=Brooklawnia sp. TaxID=2699740 RepID=UPI003C77740D